MAYNLFSRQVHHRDGTVTQGRKFPCRVQPDGTVSERSWGLLRDLQNAPIITMEAACDGKDVSGSNGDSPAITCHNVDAVKEHGIKSSTNPNGVVPVFKIVPRTLENTRERRLGKSDKPIHALAKEYGTSIKNTIYCCEEILERTSLTENDTLSQDEENKVKASGMFEKLIEACWHV